MGMPPTNMQGRYISADFSGAALHPIDLIDVTSGRIIAECIDPGLTTITPVVKFHPTEPALVSGSSRSLFLWRHMPPEAEEAREECPRLPEVSA